MSRIDLQNAMSDTLLKVVLQQKAKTLALREQKNRPVSLASKLAKAA